MAETTSGTANYYYVYPDCPFRNVCSDNDNKCETCRHNPKRSYYEPIEPYYPPYYPYWTTTFYTAT